MKLKAAFLAVVAVLFALAVLAGEGDEEGEFYGGKWPSDIPKTTPVKYNLPFPAGKSYGRMPGAASHTAVQNKHAVDFMMPTGSPVRASADGLVIKIIESGPDRGGRQNSLIIQHADGMCTCYLHLKNKGVIPRLGDFVFQGDLVAYSGASGTATPHLHFSVNKFEMLESVQFEFAEAKSQKQWVSQNYSFEEKYAKRIDEYRKTELVLRWGPSFGLWEGTVQSRTKLDELKPSDGDDIRLQKCYEKIEEASKSFDVKLKKYLEEVKAAFDAGNEGRSYEFAYFGVSDFKDTEHEKFFSDKMKAFKELDNYNEFDKILKKLKERRKKLEKAFQSDLKGETIRKIVKAYGDFVKKYKDVPEATAVKERVEELRALDMKK